MRRDVALVPEAVIVGRVVRVDDGTPVSAALVSALPNDWNPDRPADKRTVSGRDGRFRIDGVAPGVFVLHARHIGLSTKPMGVQILTEAGEQSREVVLPLEPRARLSGVVESAGQPVAGAIVSAVRSAPLANSHPTVSEADGSFSIDDAPLGSIEIAVAGYDVVSPDRISVDAAADRDGIVVEVTRLAAIRGRVTRNGEAIAGAQVCCGPTFVRRTVVSGDDGRFAFEGIPQGTYDIAAWTEEAATAPRPIKVAVGEQRDGVDLTLDIAGTIAGDVVDQDGDPVPGLTVQYLRKGGNDRCEAVTDADGAYRCGAMTGGGRYAVRVFTGADAQSPMRPARGASFPTVLLEDAASVVEHVRIRIHRETRAISGRVVDASGGPVADVRVRALAVIDAGAPRFSFWLTLPGAVTDQAGEFSIDELTDGTYALQARSARGEEAVLTTVAAGTSGVTLVLERPGAIEGKLVGFSGQPIVTAVPVEGTFRVETGIVDGDSFRIVGLRSGRYAVNAQTSAEGNASLAQVHAGEATQVVLTARGSGAIRARILEFRTSEPVAGMQCNAMMSADGHVGHTYWDTRTSPKSDDAGVVVLDPAPAGDVIVNCNPASLRHCAPLAEVSVAPGRETAVDMWTVRMAVDEPSTVGMVLDWRHVEPIVRAVVAEGPAARAGIIAGDLVTEVDGVSVERLHGYGVLYLIEGRHAGETVTVTIMRAGKRVTASMVTEPRTR
jgi:protocatechuate 3,4-dioxygenase beta subunit